MPRPTRRNTIAFLNGYEWWISKTSKNGSQFYPKRIRVGEREHPRMYYPLDREALLMLANEMQDVAQCVRLSGNVAVGWVDSWSNRIRDICGVKDDA